MWVVPYIEGNAAAVEMYKNDEAQFWGRLMDPTDDFRKEISMLLVDGAHRIYISRHLKLEDVRVCFVKPAISSGELV